MRQNAAVRIVRPRGVMTGEDIVSREIVGKTLVMEDEMVRRRILELQRNDTVTIRDGNKVSQREE